MAARPGKPTKFAKDVLCVDIVPEIESLPLADEEVYYLDYLSCVSACASYVCAAE
jgi:hypothetical protein